MALFSPHYGYARSYIQSIGVSGHMGKHDEMYVIELIPQGAIWSTSQITAKFSDLEWLNQIAHGFAEIICNQPLSMIHKF